MLQIQTDTYMHTVLSKLGQAHTQENFEPPPPQKTHATQTSYDNCL